MRSLSEYQIERYGSPIIVNLGCGKTNHKDLYGIDVLDFPGVDLVADLSESIPLDSESADVILAQDFLEHIDQKKCIKLMEEIYRVLKPNGTFIFDVPSTDGNNQGAFCDPTHISWWNQYKFKYFLDDKYSNGQRSLYNIQCWFKPEQIETYLNSWNCTYVRGTLLKEPKNG